MCPCTTTFRLSFERSWEKKKKKKKNNKESSTAHINANHDSSNPPLQQQATSQSQRRNQSQSPSQNRSPSQLHSSSNIGQEAPRAMTAGSQMMQMMWQRCTSNWTNRVCWAAVCARVLFLFLFFLVLSFFLVGSSPCPWAVMLCVCATNRPPFVTAITAAWCRKGAGATSPSEARIRGMGRFADTACSSHSPTPPPPPFFLRPSRIHDLPFTHSTQSTAIIAFSLPPNLQQPPN